MLQHRVGNRKSIKLEIERNKEVKINRIKEVLIEQNKSQAWLAQEVEKSKNTINSFCNNYSQPNVKLLHQIATLLDVDIRDLLYSTKN